MVRDLDSPLTIRVFEKVMDSIGQTLNKIVERLDGVEERLTGVEGRLIKVENRLDNVETEIHYMHDDINGLKAEFSAAPSREEFDQLENKVEALQN